MILIPMLPKLLYTVNRPCIFTIDYAIKTMKSKPVLSNTVTVRLPPRSRDGKVPGTAVGGNLSQPEQASSTVWRHAG